SDRDQSVRVAGLDLLENTTLPKSVMADLLTQVIATKTTQEQQAAITTLGKLPLENVRAPLSDLLDKMEKGTLRPDVLLELGEAIDSTHPDTLMARYANGSKHRSPDELLAAYASSLQGGDPKKGRAIFFQQPQAQCMRCHAYDDRGGN